MADQNLLRLAYRAADIGALVWHVPADRLEVDEAAERLFGLRRGTFGTTFADLVARIREESRDALTSAMEAVLGGNSLLEVDMLVDLPDGATRSLQLRGTVLHDPTGQPLHVVAALRDVSDRAALRAALAAAERELASRDTQLRQQEASAATTTQITANLLARTSHEIRTRLDAILGMTRLLADSELGHEQRELLATVRSQGEGMLSIVDDIVDMSATGAVATEAVIAIRDLLMDVLVASKTSVHVELATDVPPVIRLDAARLRRVLHNLVGVLRGHEPAIAVMATPLGGELYDLVFEARGLDLPPGRIPHLFDGSSSGGGFPLAICAKLVGHMGGRISGAASTDDRTIVRISVPVETAVREVVPETPVDPELGKKHPLRVLVAEDNIVNRKVAGAYLAKLGYQARFAGDGREALAALDRERFDVLLMDIDMPVMDGLEAAREIRRRWARSEAPRLVAVTANALPRDRAACFEAGYDDYLAKPLRIEQLAAQLARVQRLPEVELDPGSLDLGVLQGLYETVPVEVVHDLITTYDADARELLASLEGAAVRGDGHNLARAAHTLRSVSALLGARTLATMCGDVEAAVRGTEIAKACAMVGEVARELARVRAALSEHVARERE